MRRTIFNTPVVRPLCRGLSLVLWKLLGWKLIATKPEQSKFIFVAAPHTSNWDFFYMAMAIFILRMELHWMGKHTLFPRPFAPLVRWMGGIPINRSKAGNMVEQMVAEFNARSELVLLNTPEGTRSEVQEWKTGFYHIAQGAGIPILPAYVDAPKKEMGIFEPFVPTGNVEQDVLFLKSLYEGKTGFNPSQ